MFANGFGMTEFSSAQMISGPVMDPAQTPHLTSFALWSEVPGLQSYDLEARLDSTSSQLVISAGAGGDELRPNSQQRPVRTDVSWCLVLLLNRLNALSFLMLSLQQSSWISLGEIWGRSNLLQVSQWARG